jgi:Diguanylate cyclase, GGDEF domain
METQSAALAEEPHTDGQPLSRVLVDIDKFKSINDTHGHVAGDSILRELATRLGCNARSADAVCRLGGEEFVIIMPQSNLAAACPGWGAPQNQHRRSTVPGPRRDHAQGDGQRWGQPAMRRTRAWRSASNAPTKPPTWVKRSGRNRVVADAAWAAPARSPKPLKDFGNQRCRG